MAEDTIEARKRYNEGCEDGYMVRERIPARGVRFGFDDGAAECRYELWRETDDD